ncbi:cell surface protein [Candida viswanathii]|uniref:Cell surface protein n=1 Tax=Candida viswanathii TaxID=5486 RepID=A0A367YAS1_9ASCO|nr:cell surface protein [Candida viswanathii]
MSAGKYLLGTAALVGGVYYYDQYVQPILPRKQHEELAYQTKSLEQSANDINNKLTKKIDDGKNYVIKKSDAVTQQIKDTDIYQDSKKSFDNYKKSVEDATDFDKSSARKAIQKYIDFINQLGEGKVETGTTQYSTVSPNVEVKEQSIFEGWFGSGKSDAQKLKDDADRKAQEARDATKKAENGLFSWGSAKKEEADKAANDTANWANKQYNQAANEVTKQYNQAANEVNKQIDYASAEFNKYYASAEKEWNKAVDDLNKQWESTKRQVTGRYDTEKDRAIKNVQDAKVNFEQISKDAANDPYKNQKLHDAKDHFQKAVDSLRLFGDDVYNDFAKKFNELFNQK